MKTLIQLANQDFLVSPELAQRVQQVVPADRMTVTPIHDQPDHPVMAMGQQKPSVFDQARQRHDPITDREKQAAQRWADHMTKRQQPRKSPPKS